jgi:hypothetical protein
MNGTRLLWKPEPLAQRTVTPYKSSFSILGVGLLGQPYFFTISRQGGQKCHPGALYSLRFSS